MNAKTIKPTVSSYQHLFFQLRLARTYSKYLLQWMTLFFIMLFNLHSIATSFSEALMHKGKKGKGRQFV